MVATATAVDMVATGATDTTRGRLMLSPATATGATDMAATATAGTTATGATATTRGRLRLSPAMARGRLRLMPLFSTLAPTTMATLVPSLPTLATPMLPMVPTPTPPMVLTPTPMATSVVSRPTPTVL